MRQNPHVRICGGPGSATTLVYPTNSRYGRTLIGYGQCGEPGGYVGAKIAYGRIPELEDFQ